MLHEHDGNWQSGSCMHRCKGAGRAFQCAAPPWSSHTAHQAASQPPLNWHGHGCWNERCSCICRDTVNCAIMPACQGPGRLHQLNRINFLLTCRTRSPRKQQLDYEMAPYGFQCLCSVCEERFSRSVSKVAGLPECLKENA